MHNSQEKINQLFDQGYELLESGHIDEASASFQKVLELDAKHGEAWMLLGSIHAEQGNTEAAIHELNKAITLNPTLPEAYYYLANIQHQNGDSGLARYSIEKAIESDPEYGEAFLLASRICAATGERDVAEKYARQAITILPASPDTNFNLGFLLMNNGNASEASQYFARVTEMQPAASVAWLWLGRCYERMGQIDQSVAAYRTMLQLNPESAEAYYGLGYASYTQRKFAHAVEHFSQALELNPQYEAAANSLGTVYQTLGKYTEALDTFDQLLAINPESAEGLCGKAAALTDLSRQPESLPLLQKAVALKPGYIDARLNLVSTLMKFEQPEQAKQHCKTILAAVPDNYEAIALLARIELQNGNSESAYQLLNPHILSGVEQINFNLAFGDVCRGLGRSAEAIEPLEKLLRKENLTISNQRNLHFCLGQLQDKQQAYESAFTHFAAGNKLRSTSWDPALNTQTVSELINIFNKDFFEHLPCSANLSSKPIFVLGMPRSGTSLVEQILASHPLIHGAGELTNIYNMGAELPGLLNTSQPFPYCITSLDQHTLEHLTQSYLAHLDSLSPTAARVTDKMPGNFSFLGMIQLLFPGARVIHCKRDPIDTCLSCYFQDFAMSQPYAFDLINLGMFYKDYERLMAHWEKCITLPTLTIQYEELVTNQEAVSRELVAFSGLEWNDSCLSFHETKRYVATSSYDQVKHPMYTSSVKRWKNYEQQIEPLIRVLSSWPDQ